MSNTSASGGYLLPSSTLPLPDSLTLKQFIQTVLVGISGLDGKLVRASFQMNPPKQPDLPVNWLAFHIAEDDPDTFSVVRIDVDDVVHQNRNTKMEVRCSMYGPDALENCRALQDGFQIQQNLEALQLAKMGLLYTTRSIHAPELVNEKWLDRYDFSIFLAQNVQRTYPILTFVSASGRIHSVLKDGEYILDWNAEEEES